MASGPWRSMPLAPHMHPGEFNHMPSMGAKMTGGYTTVLEKIKLYFSAQCVNSEQFRLSHTPLMASSLSYLH